MRVLMINSVCGRQSTGRIVSEIRDFLIYNGNECIVAYGEKNSIVKDNDYHIGTEIDRYLHAISTRFFDNTGFCSRKSTKDFIEFIKKCNPDIIHIHNLHGYYINIKILFEFLKEYNKPIIWTLHDCWAFTGHAAYCDAVSCNKWQYGCYDCPQKKDYPKAYIDRSKKNWISKRELYSKRLDMTIVTPSKWLADLVKKSFLNSYDVKTIYNGINLDTFQHFESDLKCKYGLKDKKIILGVAAVWDRRKGLQDFIKLADLIDDSWRIVLIGVSKKQKKQLSKNMIAIENTDSTRQLAEWYSVAEVFVNLTYEDNYPTVNMEAISCGTPVITYKTGGSPESLDLHTGLVVEKGDIKGIYEAIQKIQSGFEFITNRSRHDSKLTINQYMKLYQKAIKNDKL